MDMKNILAILLSFMFLCAVEVSAQKYLDVRQYNNTYEINIYKQGDKTEAKCQAVRLSKEWFLTAAHCFIPVCDNACQITAKMADSPQYQFEMTTQHSGTSQAVYLHPKAKENQISYDIALVKFDPQKTMYNFKDKKNFILLTKQDTLSKLNPSQKTEFTQAIDGVNFPTILELKPESPKVLNKSLAVASVWAYKKDILSSEDYVFFSPKKHMLYTSNFGIRQGISGSGVMTSTGELVGIVSAVAHTRRTITDGITAQSKDIDFSMFSTFDDSVLSFLKSHIPGLPVRKSQFSDFRVVPEEYQSMAENMENI